ncbi:MAG: hypothetical protein J0649_05960 [Methylococcales bacterium]|nr:hypothetical protein [Methylococcales bacterium]
MINGTAVPGLNRSEAYQLIVSVPSLYDQEKIIKKIAMEEQLIESNKLTINIMQQKINDVLEGVFSKNT